MRVVAAVVLAVLCVALAVTMPAAGWDTSPPGSGEQPLDAVNGAVGTDPNDGRIVTRVATNGPGEHPAVTGPDSQEQYGTVVNVSYTYQRLPEQPGLVEVRMHVSATAPIEPLSVEFPGDVTVMETENVERSSGYEWAGGQPAELVYRLPINWTYVGNSGDSWTLVEHRPPSVDAGAAVTVREHVGVAGDGYVGNRTILLGAHDVYQRQADRERIDLVVPGNVQLLYGPRRTVDALANASEALRIGARDDIVHAFATPGIRTAASFVQPGFRLDDSTLLVDADSELDVWLHEYVHTRQELPASGSLRWSREGSAEYYGWLLSIQQGYESWEPLQRTFERAAGDTSVLAEPGTWGGETDYAKGALVLAVLDREIRTATDGERTLQNALRRVNGNQSDPTVGTFVESVRRVGGPDAAATAERYLTTGAVPEYRPQRDQLEAVYGYASPRMQAETTGLTAAGATWNRSLDPRAGQLRVGLGETLRVSARVTNAGDAGGVAAVAPRVSAEEADLDRFDSPWIGWVSPNGSVVRTATHQFSRPGTYDVAWRGFPTALPYDVAVVPDRGTASVTGLNVTRNPTAGGQAVVEATVRNDGDRSTFATLPVSLDGQRVTTAALVLDGGATRTTTVEVGVPERTPYTVTVGTASTIVGQSVSTEPTGSESTAGSASTPAPGTPDDSASADAPTASLLGVLVILVLSGIPARWLGATGRE